MWLKQNSLLNNSAVSQFIQSEFDPFANRAHSSSGSPVQINSISPSQINYQSTSLNLPTYYDTIQFHTFNFFHLVHYFPTLSLAILLHSSV